MIRSIEALVTPDLAPVASAGALFLAGEELAVQEQIRLDVNARRVSGMSANFTAWCSGFVPNTSGALIEHGCCELGKLSEPQLDDVFDKFGGAGDHDLKRFLCS